VPLFDLKFLIEFAARDAGTSKSAALAFGWIADFTARRLSKLMRAAAGTRRLAL
jgi:hypothetical protein